MYRLKLIMFSLKKISVPTRDLIVSKWYGQSFSVDHKFCENWAFGF